MSTRGERLLAQLAERDRGQFMEQFAEEIVKHEGVNINGETIRFVRESTEPVAPAPVEKAEPTLPADLNAAKAAAATAVKEKPRFAPGESRSIATSKLAQMVDEYRKEHPNVSAAQAWAEVLETEEGARWYNLGEVGEQEARRKK